jgi:hypothetical protein
MDLSTPVKTALNGQDETHIRQVPEDFVKDRERPKICDVDVVYRLQRGVRSPCVCHSFRDDRY